jgi:hypothetical protein
LLWRWSPRQRTAGNCPAIAGYLADDAAQSHPPGRRAFGPRLRVGRRRRHVGLLVSFVIFLAEPRQVLAWWPLPTSTAPTRRSSRRSRLSPTWHSLPYSGASIPSWRVRGSAACLVKWVRGYTMLRTRRLFDCVHSRAGAYGPRHESFDRRHWCAAVACVRVLHSYRANRCRAIWQASSPGSQARQTSGRIW